VGGLRIAAIEKRKKSTLVKTAVRDLPGENRKSSKKSRKRGGETKKGNRKASSPRRVRGFYQSKVVEKEM